MKYNNLSIEHYEDYKNLINSDFTRVYFNYFLNNVLNDNHVIIVLENDGVLRPGMNGVAKIYGEKVFVFNG